MNSHTETVKVPTRRSFLKSTAAFGGGVFLAPLAATSASAQDDIGAISRECLMAQAEALARIGVDFDLPLAPANTASLSRNDFITVVAPSLELPQIDPVTYAAGVDLGLVYLDSGGRGVPTGTYRLRATAPITELGEVRGVVEVITREGETIARLESTFDTFSLEAPPDARQTTIELGIRSDPENMEALIVIIVFWCENGTHGVIVWALL